MCSEARVVPGSPRFFSSPDAFGFPNVQGYVAQVPTQDSGSETSSNTCIISFRGSVEVMNYVRDGKFWHTSWPNWEGGNKSMCPGCQVHTGVAECYSDLRSNMLRYVRELNCKRLRLAGHSLGGGIVSLASMELRSSGFLVDKVYTFGKLRVGNEAYAAAYIAAAERQGVDPPMWRLVNQHDPVPRLPPMWTGPYVHTPVEVYYESPGTFKICCSSSRELENSTCGVSVGLPACLSNSAHDHNTYLNLSTIGSDLAAACLSSEMSGRDPSSSTETTLEGFRLPSRSQLAVII